MTFSDLGLSPETLSATSDTGYTDPTPIQAEAIPHILAGRDLLGCAQTGTGKTASFTLPMIDMLSKGRARARMPRSLILAPTRELATQVSESFETYGKYHKLAMALLIGGVSMDEQTRKLDRGVDVLVATPGRMLDHFERGAILLTDIRILVIDEADRMLDMGFIPDIERIVSLLPRTRQTLLFSATIPPEIRRLSEAFLTAPEEITVAPNTHSAADTVTQHLSVVAGRDKREALRRILRGENVGTALIFCNRKRDVDILFKSLASHGFDAAALHGDMDQRSRQQTLDRFKEGEIGLLVASDVAARGLDIDDLPTVVNFDVPFHSEDYIHRIGRTGRAGRDGKAYTLATPEDGPNVEAIEKLIGGSIPRLDVDGLAGEDLDAAARRRTRRPRRRGSETARTERKAAPDEPKDRPKRSRQRGERRQAPARREPVVGLGDHVPDFLARPARASEKAS